MEPRAPLYELLIFVCTNDRGPEAPRISCAQQDSAALHLALKTAVKELGLDERVRVHKSGCMEGCEIGPNVLVYPAGVMYAHCTLADAQAIIDRHVRPLLADS